MAKKTVRKRLRRKDIREDRLITVALKTSNYIQANFAKVISGVVVLVAIVGVLLFTAQARRSSAAAAEQEFARAMDQFLLDEKEQASTAFSAIASRYSGQRVGKLALYFLGECYLAEFRHQEALDAYERYLSRAGESGEYVIAAEIAKALCYEGLGEFQTAAEAMEAVASRLDSKDARYINVLFQTASFYELAGKPDKAAEYYERVVKEGTGKVKQRADVRLAFVE